jgi:hypothetical protein
MTDFWPSCGFAALQRDARGWLTPTPAYIHLLLQRPELALVPESCAAEMRLHRALQAEPLRPVAPAELARLQDADARENYQVFLAFRDALLAAGTLEGYYLQLFRQGVGQVPPAFIDALAQAILRNILDGCDDARQARAAELLFRPQRISLQDGQVLAADQATVQQHSESGGLGELGRLLLQNKTPLREAQLTVLDDTNAARYWQGSERHAFVLDLTHEITQELSHGLTLRMNRARSGLKALAQVLERWVQHLLGVAVTIEPLASVDDPHWRWHVGLDAEASALLNDLYEGRSLEHARQQRLISLFRLSFVNPQDMLAEVAGVPVYLGLAMTATQTLRLKPQNLLLNLPLAGD